MTPILYSSDEIDFLNNGLGQLVDLYDVDIHEQRNGLLNLTAYYPVNGQHYADISEGNIILAKPSPLDDNHAFRIVSVALDITGYAVMIEADSITYDLTNNLSKTIHMLGDGQAAMTAIQNSTLHPHIFTFYSDITHTSESQLRYVNPMEAIAGTQGSFLQIWGGELKRENRRVAMFNRRGRDNVATFRLGKNVAGLKYTVDVSNLTTEIVPTVTVNSTDTSRTVEGATVQSSRMGNYPLVYSKMVDVSQDVKVDEGDTDDQIKAKINAFAADWFVKSANTGKDLPEVTVEVEVESLQDSADYADKFAKLETIGLTDTVTVYVPEFGVNVTAIVNELHYDPVAERVTKLSIGTAKVSWADSNKNALNDLQDKVTEVKEQATQAVVSANGKNSIYSGRNAPAHPQEGDTWFWDDGTDSGIRVFTNGVWVDSVDTKTLERINNAVDGAVSEATSYADSLNSAQASMASSVSSSTAAALSVASAERNSLANSTSSMVADAKATSKSLADSAYAGAMAGVTSAGNLIAGVSAAVRDMDSKVAANKSGITKVGSDLATGVASAAAYADSLTAKVGNSASAAVSSVAIDVTGVKAEFDSAKKTAHELSVATNSLSVGASGIATKLTEVTSTANGAVSAVASVAADVSGVSASFNQLSNTVANWSNNTRNYLLGTKVGFDVVGNGAVNQGTPSYVLSVGTGYNLQQKLGAGVAMTLSFDWSISGETIAGNFWPQFNGSPWGIGAPKIVVDAEHTSGHYVVNFKLPAMTTDSTAKGMMLRLDNLTGTVSISNMMLVLGSAQADWQPAPEDIENSLSSASASYSAGIAGLSASIDTMKSTESTLTKATNSLAVTASGLTGQMTSVSSTASGAMSAAASVAANVSGVSASFNKLNDTVTRKVVSGTVDLNTYVTSGKWFFSGSQTNAPQSGWSYVDVDAPRTDRLIQTWTYDQDVSLQYSRYSIDNGKTWSSWVKAVQASDVTTAVSSASASYSAGINGLSADIKTVDTNAKGYATAAQNSAVATASQIATTITSAAISNFGSQVANTYATQATVNQTASNWATAVTELQGDLSNSGVRYVRINGQGNNENNGTHFAEMQVINSRGVNVASGIIPTKTGSGTLQTPASLTDGNFDSYAWINNEPNNDSYIVLDLGSVMLDLQEIKLKMYRSTRLYYAVTVQVSSNGDNWKTVFHENVQATTDNSYNARVGISGVTVGRVSTLEVGLDGMNAAVSDPKKGLSATWNLANNGQSIAVQASNTATTALTTAQGVQTTVNNWNTATRNYIANSKNVWITESDQSHQSYSFTVPAAEFSGKTITVSVQVDANDVIGSRVGIEPLFIPSGTNSGLYAGKWLTIPTATTTSKRIYGTWTLPNNITGVWQMQLYIQGVTSGTVKLSKPMLTMGNVLTDWQPAPEDTDNAIQSVQTQLAGQITDEVANRTNGDNSVRTQLTDLVNQQVTSVTNGYKTAITQASDAIMASVSGVNLFTFSRFEGSDGTLTSTTNQWPGARSTNGTVTKSAYNTSGNNQIQVVATGTWQGYWHKNIPVTPGQVMSASVLAMSDGTAVASLDLWFIDASGARVSSAAQGTTKSTSWTLIKSENFTVPAKAAALQMSLLSNVAGTVYFTQPMLNIGPKVLPYVPDTTSDTVLQLFSDNFSVGIKNNTGALISGINADTSAVRIAAKQLIVSADTTFQGTNWLDGAIIKNASIGGAQIAKASITNANIVNLDVNKITGEVANFIRAYWDGEYGSTSITSEGMTVSAGVTTTVFDENGMQFNKSSRSVGRIGVNDLYQDNSKKGLYFGLESTGDFMAWGAQNYAGNPYSTKLSWFRAGAVPSNLPGLIEGFNFEDNVAFINPVEMRGGIKLQGANDRLLVRASNLNGGSYPTFGGPSAYFVYAGSDIYLSSNGTAINLTKIIKAFGGIRTAAIPTGFNSNGTASGWYNVNMG